MKKKKSQLKKIRKILDEKKKIIIIHLGSSNDCIVAIIGAHYSHRFFTINTSTCV